MEELFLTSKKDWKRERKNPSKQSIFRLKYNFPRYDVNASSYFAQSRCTKILTAWDNDWINLVRPSFLSKWIFWTVMPLRCDGIFSLFTIVATRSRKMRIASFIEVSPRRREGYSVSIFTRSPRQKRRDLVFSTRKCINSRALTSRTKWSNFLQGSIKIWQSESNRDQIPLFPFRYLIGKEKMITKI